MRDHEANAAAAESTALRASDADPSEAAPSTDPSAGLNTSNSRPKAAARHVPSMYSVAAEVDRAEFSAVMERASRWKSDGLYGIPFGMPCQCV